MKIFISTDLEGVSGVVGAPEVNPDDSRGYYELATRRLTADINAAVEGALESGASEILVADAHGLAMNINYEELHPEAQLIRGAQTSHRPFIILQGIDRSFDLVLLVGFHAKAGQWPAILSHTYSSMNFSRVRFNGVEVSEARIGAAIAGAFGVPVGMVSGDDQTCAEVASWQPTVETAVVKYAIDRTAARCVSHTKALTLIREAASRAVGRASQFKPIVFEPPVRVEVAFIDVSTAYRCTVIPGVERVAADTIAYVGKDFLDALAAFTAMLYVSYSRTPPPPRA
jgi:D-amino peptidase